MNNTTKNVHSAGGDLLVVIPTPGGWSICWYMPEEDGRSESLPQALSGAIEPEEDYDDDDGDGDDELDEEDEQELRFVREWCIANGIKQCVSEEDSVADHFVWTTREAAQKDADTMMNALRAMRSAPWADAAIAAGWTPPAEWAFDAAHRVKS